MEIPIHSQIKNVAKQLVVPSEKINRFQWQELLQSAIDPDLKIVVSNNHEYDICFGNANTTSDRPPGTVVCKILALLYNRFLYYNSGSNRGLTIINKEFSNEE